MVRTLAIVAIAAALGGAIAACGAAKPAAHAPAAETMATQPTGRPLPTPRDELDALFERVESERMQLELPEPEPEMPGTPATPMSLTPKSTDATCKPAKTERCTSSCTLSDSICSNATRICELASELPGDTYAADKCSRSKQTCSSAHTSCCSCQ